MWPKFMKQPPLPDAVSRQRPVRSTGGGAGGGGGGGGAAASGGGSARLELAHPVSAAKTSNAAVACVAHTRHPRDVPVAIFIVRRPLTLDEHIGRRSVKCFSSLHRRNDEFGTFLDTRWPARGYRLGLGIKPHRVRP